MLARLFLLAVLSPVLYVVSVVAWFPAICWHGVLPPRASGLMAYRVAEAAAGDRDFRPRHEWAPIEAMPTALLRAVLVAEDTRFYNHDGFDLEQIREAWRANRSGERLRGASTITQQTAKNVYLDPSRNFLRKAREAILTGWLELWHTKDGILELYLNVVELGPGIFGVRAASDAYFELAPEELSREQAALLAATLPAPLARNPAASSNALYRRQRMILSRMGRWYEGPSLAEEDLVAESRDTVPERVPSEPIEFDPESGAIADTAAEAGPAAADSGEAPNDDGVPVDEPSVGAVDSVVSQR